MKLSYKQKYLLLRNILATIGVVAIYSIMIVQYLKEVGIIC